MSTRRQTIFGTAGLLLGGRNAAAKDRPVLVNAHHTG